MRHHIFNYNGRWAVNLKSASLQTLHRPSLCGIRQEPGWEGRVLMPPLPIQLTKMFPSLRLCWFLPSPSPTASVPWGFFRKWNLFYFCGKFTSWFTWNGWTWKTHGSKSLRFYEYLLQADKSISNNKFEGQNSVGHGVLLSSSHFRINLELLCLFHISALSHFPSKKNALN